MVFLSLLHLLLLLLHSVVHTSYTHHHHQHHHDLYYLLRFFFMSWGGRETERRGGERVSGLLIHIGNKTAFYIMCCFKQTDASGFGVGWSECVRGELDEIRHAGEHLLLVLHTDRGLQDYFAL